MTHKPLIVLMPTPLALRRVANVLRLGTRLWIKDQISSSEQVRRYHAGRITMTAASVLKLALYIGTRAERGREMPRKNKGI